VNARERAAWVERVKARDASRATAKAEAARLQRLENAKRTRSVQDLTSNGEGVGFHRKRRLRF
jgi:hypothetical protein